MNSRKSECVVFILTHGRPDNVVTWKTLQKSGYTGPCYLVIDNEDKHAAEYFEQWGKDAVLQFDKKEMADQVDEGNNFNERRTITHARNACFELARQLGYTYFLELDDDYTSFEFRHIDKAENKLLVTKAKDLDAIVDAYLKFLKETPFCSVAFAQGGDFIGGAGNPYAKTRPLMRKCMNSFMCSTERPFQFVGAMNEDVNTYTTLGSRGVLFGTLPFVALVQKRTQSQEGGITGMYLKFGTYCKGFTTVMMMPSCVRVAVMNTNNPRLHHKIHWIATVPKILDEKWRKAA
jgi:hypothetical protein